MRLTASFSKEWVLLFLRWSLQPLQSVWVVFLPFNIHSFLSRGLLWIEIFFNAPLYENRVNFFSGSIHIHLIFQKYWIISFLILISSIPLRNKVLQIFIHIDLLVNIRIIKVRTSISAHAPQHNNIASLQKVNKSQIKEKVFNEPWIVVVGVLL
mgnify:CR=1 FL=1